MPCAQATLRVLAFLLPVLLALPAGAEPQPTAELRLEDGRVVQLAGIALPSGAPGIGPPPTLAGLRLEPATPPQDRYGRLRAQVHAADGRWLQAELVREGAALVAPGEDVADATLAALLALEREAREARRGVWATAAAGPWPADAPQGLREGYGLVTGRVVAVARARGFVYVNFGRRWRQDFTLRAEERVAGRLARQGLDLARLEGRNLIVRGMLFETDGPMIELVHPAQIEVLE
jgi:hypothetical protein